MGGGDMGGGDMNGGGMAEGPCSACDWSYGKCFLPHEEFCDSYYVCVQGWYSKPDRAFQKRCDPGMFWNQMTMDCAPAAEVDCLNDICKMGGDSYRYDGNCVSYWSCMEGMTVGLECCMPGTSYAPGIGCMTDMMCMDDCEMGGMTQPDMCMRMTFYPDKTKFYEKLPTGMVLLRNCAAGAAFSRETCDCSFMNGGGGGGMGTECGTENAEIYLPFDMNVEDASMNQLTIVNDGPIVINNDPAIMATGGGAAEFDGVNVIQVPRFENDDMRTDLVVQFRFLESELAPGACVILVTQDDCMGQFSFTIKYNSTMMTVDAFVQTSDGMVELHVFAGHTTGAWKSVELKYDGEMLTLDVDGLSRSAPLTGEINQVAAPLQLGGGCSETEAFTGLIDEVSVYKCIPGSRW